MIPKEILRQIKRIEITTKRLVSETFGGEYTSVFKGQGIEFADVREYVPGDEIRSIDWNVTARSDRPFVKQFVEERQLTVLFLVDMSGSAHFGSGEKFKAEVAAELCALLAFSANKNNDRVGLIIFTDEVEKYIAPSKGARHVLRVVREILYYQPKSRGTNLKGALEFLDRILTRTAVVFVISDFLGESAALPLKRLSKRHDVIAMRIYDPREQILPRRGIVQLIDAETGERRLADCGSATVRRKYEEKVKVRTEEILNLFKRIGVDHIDINARESYVDPVLKFFKEREDRY
ncbi:MAG: DUF58 domain-containing protein [Candidatus Omnitrophica bacterium]|nr:DUF58 domain-containing protein [Candidatus Omnitrophota bacterium]